MEDNELIFVDTTEDHVPTQSSDSIPDDRESVFRDIIRDSGTRVNIDNLTQSFFSGNVEDRDRLVRVLKKAQIAPAKVETIYSVWFGGAYPEDDGIDLYARPLKSGDVAESDDEYDTEKLMKDMDLQERLAQKKRINALQAKKLEIEMKRDIKELTGTKTDSTETKERIEPVMVMDDSGNIEIAKDEQGTPITRRIVEPVSGSSGSSSMTELMLMQNMLGRGNNGNNDGGLHEVKIQSLESEITRLRDKIESEKERFNDRIQEKDARIESIKDNASNDVLRIKEDKDKEIVNTKDQLNAEISRIRDDKDKEIGVLMGRHEDKITNMENRHADAIAAIDDKYTNREERINDKMDRIESDAADTINGLQARHHDDLERLRIDYTAQMKTFIDRADDNLDNTSTMYRTDLTHRDDMSTVKEQNDVRFKQLEQDAKDKASMTEAERQNSQIIEAFGGGIEKALETFGKPYASGMVTQNTITQQAVEKQSINEKLALVDDMRRNDYTEEEISFVTNPNAAAPQQSHDDVYERILEEGREEGDMIDVDQQVGFQAEVPQQQHAPAQHVSIPSQQITIPQNPHDHAEDEPTIVMRSAA